MTFLLLINENAHFSLHKSSLTPWINLIFKGVSFILLKLFRINSN